MKRPAEKPDWVDILLAATLASWGTIMAVMSVLLLAQLLIDFSSSSVVQFFSMLIATAFFGFLLAIFVCVAFGLPALALAGMLKLGRWWQWALVGAVTGFLVVLVFPGLLGAASREGIVPVALSVLVFVIAGALAGVAAWRERKKGDVAA